MLTKVKEEQEETSKQSYIVIDKTSLIAKNIQNIIGCLGVNTEYEGIKNTPLRASKALQFLTKGYEEDLSEIVNGALFPSEFDDIVLVDNIEFYSLCEHHLLPFFGECSIGYIPNGKIIGLSKIPRIVNVFSRRLQVQENLAMQIANCLQSITNAKGVMVFIKAEHLCMKIRGVEKQKSKTITQFALGNFRTNKELQSRFYNGLRT